MVKNIGKSIRIAAACSLNDFAISFFRSNRGRVFEKGLH
jgi:hypothetical protein